MDEHTLHLLVVDDDADDFVLLRDLLHRALPHSPLRVDHASSLAEAMAATEACAYNLFFLDYRLGAETGLDVMLELKRRNADAPIIFLTGQGGEDVAVEVMKAGAADYLQKSKLNESSLRLAVRYTVNLQKKEELLKQSREALRSEKERLARLSRQNELLLNSAGEGIVGIDLEGRQTFLNAAAAKLLGYEPAEVIGRRSHELWHYARPDGSPFPAEECPVYRSFREGQVYHGHNEFFWRKDGQGFPVECISTPVREDGKVVGSVLVFQDITERRSLEQQLLHAQKMEAIGQLAGGVAHDFNNLLMVISSYAELLASSVTDMRQRHQADEILKAARRAAALTGQLLAFSRKQVMMPQILDLNGVVREIGRMLPRLIGEDIRVSLALGPDLGYVKADPLQIEQVIMNLAVNARDAMPQGGSLTIETGNVELDADYARAHALTPGPYIMLAVSDTGCGMNAAVRPHIFEPFFTTKEPGKGTGLGLSTVYGIVQQSGGHIFVYSEAGQGTTMKVYLPRVKPGVAPQPRLQPPLEIDLHGSETILLVEDEPAVRQAARDFLIQHGYLVLQAGNGVEAVAVSRAHQGDIAVLLTDVVMPEMNGPELASCLLAERPEMKVLYMSGYTETRAAQQGAGDGTFLQKPFTLSALAKSIRQVLQRKPQAAAQTA